MAINGHPKSTMGPSHGTAREYLPRESDGDPPPVERDDEEPPWLRDRETLSVGMN